MGCRRLVIGMMALVLDLISGTACLAEETQGVYLEYVTVTETSTPRAFVSTGRAEEDLVVTDHVTGNVVWSQSVVASEQANGPTPWIDAEWSRSVDLPQFPPGFYVVGVDPTSVVPATVEFHEETYRMPLFVVPTSPTADVLLVFASLTSTCYNSWGGHSCYTSPPQPYVGHKRPGVFGSYLRNLKKVIERANALGISWDIVDERFLEDNPDFILGYRAVVMVFQHEYLTLPMRDTVEGYVNSGGRLLMLGNEGWIYQVRREGDTYLVYKNPGRLIDPYDSDGDTSNDHLIAYEWVRGTPVSNTTGPNRPETRVLGQSTWLGYHADVPYWTAWRTGHWFYAGTGLADGDPFRDGLSGGQALKLSQILGGVKTAWAGGLPFVDQEEIFEVPNDVLVLATIESMESRPWNCEPNWDSTQANCGAPSTAAITIRPAENDGVVMVLPDHNWVLNIPADTLATQMTDNALAAFAAPAPLDVYAGYSIPFSVPTISQWWSVPVALFLIHQIWAFRARRQQ